MFKKCFLYSMFGIAILGSSVTSVQAKDWSRGAYADGMNNACMESSRLGRKDAREHCEVRGKSYSEITVTTPGIGSSGSYKSGNQWFCKVNVSYVCN